MAPVCLYYMQVLVLRAVSLIYYFEKQDFAKHNRFAVEVKLI